jgi:hypothetical protein
MRLMTMLTLVALAACGGAQSPAVNATGGGGFDAMSAGQKMAFMKSTVSPKMKAEFQAFDPNDYADFSCKTCHGAGADNGNYKMPNPDLPKLDVANGFAKDKEHHPKAMEFMLHKVQPEMAQMLGQPEYSESNHDGFGCMECHTAAP